MTSGTAVRGVPIAPATAMPYQTTHPGRSPESPAPMPKLASRPIAQRLARLFPEQVDVRAIRERVRLSQEGFALRFGFSAAAVRDWEQGRRRPDQAARVLLLIIKHDPEAVDRALHSELGETMPSVA
jgi:putative transcriptional regulator